MSDIVTSRVFVDGEKGITAAKLNQIISGAVIQPSFVSGKPASSTLDPTDQLLELKGAGTYATITGQQLIDSVAISVRRNAFNAVGNPTFEVNQRSPATAVTGTGSGWPCDRWQATNTCSTLRVSTIQAGDNTTRILLPGTSFAISSKVFSITLSTQQASLAAGDVLFFPSVVEGPAFREIVSDVSSLSLLVNCNSAIKFSAYLRESTGTPAHSLVKLCTVTTPNVWTLVKLPNIPVFPTGAFSTLPGVAGYEVGFTLACGSTYIAAADTWLNGNFIGASGMDNFGNLPLSTVFQAAFVQHEPGALCTAPIDCPFSQNLDACLRYYQKSYDYNTKPGTVSSNGCFTSSTYANGHPAGYVSYPKRLAKNVTPFCYSTATGASSAIRDNGAGVDRTVSGTFNPGEAGFGGFLVSAVNASATNYYGQYVVDTGW